MCDWQEVHGGQQPPFPLRTVCMPFLGQMGGVSQPSHGHLWLHLHSQLVEEQTQGLPSQVPGEERASGHGPGGEVCWESYGLVLVPFLWSSHHSRFPQVWPAAHVHVVATAQFLLCGQQLDAEPLPRQCCGGVVTWVF